MRYLRWVIIGFLFLSTSPALSFAGARAIAAAKTTSIKPELAGVHPRVFVSAAEIDELRVRARTTHREIWTRAIELAAARRARSKMAYGEVAYGDVAYDIAGASLAYAIERRPEYLAAAKRWMLEAVGNESRRDARNTRDRANVHVGTNADITNVDVTNVDITNGQLLYAIGWAYDLLYNELTVDERVRVRASLERLAALVYDSYSDSPGSRSPGGDGEHTPAYESKRDANDSASGAFGLAESRGVVATAGLGVAALALWGESADAPKWAAFARAYQVHVAASLSADGYFGALQNWRTSAPAIVHFLDAWEHCTGESLWELGPYRNWKYFVAHMVRPDGSRPQRPGNFNVLYRVASRFNDAEAQAVAARMATLAQSNAEDHWTLLWYDASLTPAAMSKLPLWHYFADAGIVCWRSGWDPLATGFVVNAKTEADADAGADAGADSAAGSFTIYSEGHRLASSPGYIGAPFAKFDTIRIARADLWGDAAKIVIEAAGVSATPTRGALRLTRTFTFATNGTFHVVDDVEGDEAAAVRWQLRGDAPFTAPSDSDARSGSRSGARDGGNGSQPPQQWIAMRDGVALKVDVDAPAQARVTTGQARVATQAAEGRGSIAERAAAGRGSYELTIDSAAARHHRFDVRLTVRGKVFTEALARRGVAPTGNITARINAPPALAAASVRDGRARNASRRSGVASNAGEALSAGGGVVSGGSGSAGRQSEARAGVRPIEYRDVTYTTVPIATAGDGPAASRPLQLDIFQHPDAQRATGPAIATPVFVFIHGGGWTHGERHASYGAFRPMLEMGASVVSVEYRLAVEAAAPAAVQDVRCALAWVAANAAAYRFDPARIIVMGTSAGGHLALMSGMPPRGTPDVDRPACGDTPPVAAIVDFYGITDVNAWSRDNTSAQRWIGDRKDRDDFEAFAARMSPMSYVRRGLPPIFLIHGDADRTVTYEQSVRLHDALTRAGVETKFVTVPGGAHGNFSDAEVDGLWTAIREFLTRQKLIASTRAGAGAGAGAGARTRATAGSR